LQRHHFFGGGGFATGGIGGPPFFVRFFATPFVFAIVNPFWAGVWSVWAVLLAELVVQLVAKVAAPRQFARHDQVIL